jgi:hypothetical protein
LFSSGVGVKFALSANWKQGGKGGRSSDFTLGGVYLAGVPVVNEERYGGAQVGEEEVQGELMVPTQPARQRAQVEDEEAQRDDHALPHLGTGVSCVHISRQIRNRIATTGITPSPIPLRVAKADRKLLSEKITPLLPHWDRRAL